MADIIVTTPKGRMAEAAQEAAECKEAGGGFYFRRLPWAYDGGPCAPGDRVYYVEDGFVRGFAVVDHVEIVRDGRTCQTTGRRYGPGVYLWMRADSWKWIRPIPMRGFQNFRYREREIATAGEIVGGWLDPKPATLEVFA